MAEGVKACKTYPEQVEILAERGMDHTGGRYGRRSVRQNRQ